MSLIVLRKRGREKRRPLDQPQVVRAALALLDEAGLDELTMRRLADTLGVKAAALYRHVRDKNELLALLGEEIAGEIPFARLSGHWRDQLREIAWNVRRGLLAHRDAARVLAESPPVGERRLRHIERLLGVLRQAGLNDRDAARAGYHLNNFVTEFVADEARFAAFTKTAGSRRKLFAQVRRDFKSLSKDDYPTIVTLADQLTEDAPDDLFEFGVELWLRGIESLAKRKPAPSRTSRR